MKIPPEEVDGKIIAIINEIQEVRGRVAANFNVQLDEIKKLNESIEQLRASIQSINETLNKFNRSTTVIEKRVEGVRADASAGIVLSILVFAVLFIISFVVR